MIAKKHLPNYTYRDYEQWEGNWELISGIPYAMSPAPNIKHQGISLKMGRYFDEALENCKKCKVFAPIDWKIGEQTIVQPDLLVLCHEAEGQYLEKAPELVVEILSPSTAHKDRHLKYELYEAQGVKYYLIVDPIKDIIEVFCLENESYEKIAILEKDSQNMDFSVSDCTFSVNFSKIW